MSDAKFAAALAALLLTPACALAATATSTATVDELVVTGQQVKNGVFLDTANTLPASMRIGRSRP